MTVMWESYLWLLLLSPLFCITRVTYGTLTHAMLDGDCPGPSTLYVGRSVQVSLCRNPHQYPEGANVQCQLIFRAQHKRCRLFLVWDVLILHPGENIVRIFDNFDRFTPGWESVDPTSSSPRFLSKGNEVRIFYDGLPHLDTFTLTVTEVLESADCHGGEFMCDVAWPPFCISDSLLCNGENNCGDHSDEKLPICMSSHEESTPTPTSSSPLPLGLVGALGGVVFAIIILIGVCIALHMRRRHNQQPQGGPAAQGPHSPLNPNSNPNTRALDQRLHRREMRESNEYVPLPTSGTQSNGYAAAPPQRCLPQYMNSGTRELPDLFNLADMDDMLVLHTAGYPRPLLPSAAVPSDHEVSISEPGYMDISTLSSGYTGDPEDRAGTQPSRSTGTAHEAPRRSSLPHRTREPQIAGDSDQGAEVQTRSGGTSHEAPRRSSLPQRNLPRSQTLPRVEEPTHLYIDFARRRPVSDDHLMPEFSWFSQSRATNQHEDEHTHYYLDQFSSPPPRPRPS